MLRRNSVQPQCIRHALGRFVRIWTFDSQGTADTLLQVRPHYAPVVTHRIFHYRVLYRYATNESAIHENECRDDAPDALEAVDYAAKRGFAKADRRVSASVRGSHGLAD